PVANRHHQHSLTNRKSPGRNLISGPAKNSTSNPRYDTTGSANGSIQPKGVFWMRMFIRRVERGVLEQRLLQFFCKCWPFHANATATRRGTGNVASYC